MENNKKLQQNIKRLIKLAKEVCPDLQYDVLSPGHSDTDANIHLYCPRKYWRKIDKVVGDIELELLLKKDIFITTHFRPLLKKSA